MDLDSLGPPETRAALWRALAYGNALILALGLSWFVFRIPLQVSDCLLLLLDSLRAPSLLAFAQNHSDAGAYFRPLFWAQVKLLFDTAHGHYALVFKSFHAIQIIALLLLFARLADVRTAIDLAAFSAASVVLIGTHTFLGLVWEAYPVNHYLEVCLACMLALNLSVSPRPNLGRDVGAVVTLASALMILETGVLVWVCLAAAYLAGARGVSRRAVLVCTLLLITYFGVRFGVMDLNMPSLLERSSGFGFARLEPLELKRRFGDGPALFYGYNLISSILTVLWSEPRGGEWMLTRALVQGGLEPWMVINGLSSFLATTATAWFLVRGQKGPEGSRTRVVRGVAPAVLVINAAISYAYTKDVIVAPAGLLYAWLAYAAIRATIARLTRHEPTFAVLTLGVCLFLGSAAWSVRAVGTFYNMRQAAFEQRNEWAEVDQWLASQGIQIRDPADAQLVDTLRRQALGMKAAGPHFAQRSARRFFDQGQR